MIAPKTMPSPRFPLTNPIPLRNPFPGAAPATNPNTDPQQPPCEPSPAQEPTSSTQKPESAHRSPRGRGLGKRTSPVNSPDEEQ